MSHNSNLAIAPQPTPEEYERVFGHPEPVPGEHKTVYVESLDADIDEQVVGLVLQFNKSGLETVSSCQGDPGIIGSQGGRYGHVCFTLSDRFNHALMADFLFGFIYNLTNDLWDDVRVEMTTSSDGFLGWLYFRNECIEELLGRFYEEA